MGIAVNRNNRVMPHKDVTDFHDKRAVMCCFGNFRDGELLWTVRFLNLQALRVRIQILLLFVALSLNE